MQNNGKAIILPAVEMPTSGMKMKMSSKNGVLTIEFEKSCEWLQFNKADACAFIKGLVAHVNAMTAIIVLIVGISSTAFADESYDAGYNAGYYQGVDANSESSSYGRGVGDGNYDSGRDDAQAQKRSKDFENSLTQEQSKDYGQYRGYEQK